MELLVTFPEFAGEGFNMNGVHVEAVRGTAKKVLRASVEACRCINFKVVLAHFALIPKWSWPNFVAASAVDDGESWRRRLPEKPARGWGEGWWVAKWSFRQFQSGRSQPENDESEPRMAWCWFF